MDNNEEAFLKAASGYLGRGGCGWSVSKKFLQVEYISIGQNDNLEKKIEKLQVRYGEVVVVQSW